ncbi:175c8d9f-837a-4ac4-a1c0-9063bd526075 [Thermothielavioides terrestris]|uniref:Aminoglycoside phosphotransferase domain-containing protein n=2 Tax=Thermothielavioides terrestris TaxID=2587410 RepID=G2QWX9_THETT|nr:uncharacterized protein THITE_2109559 [Thermothielavioides terrestris NRRL 8126]AEO63945.1 hypothetical protein THITE_2109559 [Thermothielavioides terrestris NRRL 8126]SPQ23320.1 175c8d9f-837a-4ac4-a1c0-9063bd526075 [Thermothielavioides terrestris]
MASLAGTGYPPTPVIGEDQSFSAPQTATHPDHGDNDDSISASEFNRRLRRMYRERMLAKGIRVPDSPPPPPKGSIHPLAQSLLDAGGTVIYEKLTCCLIKHVCGTRVTKFRSLGFRRAEAEAMRFVSAHTSIPIPRVYDVGERHLTMEFIEGETLATAWDKLSAEDRLLVTRQLRDYVGQLRTFKSPDGLICSFDGGPAVDARRLCHVEGGPFATEAAYNDFLVSDLLGKHASIRDMIRSQMRTDHEIVLSHGDLHDINIMVRPGAGVVAIVDWELAGYYPEYVDLVRLFRSSWLCGYYDELLNIFPRRYDAEFVVDQTITHWSAR